MGMFLEVLPNNPILANIDHLMQFVCYRERNLIYGIHNCSISNIFGDLHITKSKPKHGTNAIFLSHEKLFNHQLRWWVQTLLLHENLLWALENKAMDKNETKQKDIMKHNLKNPSMMAFVKELWASNDEYCSKTHSLQIPIIAANEVGGNVKI
jgi:hypothetical protein